MRIHARNARVEDDDDDGDGDEDEGECDNDKSMSFWLTLSHTLRWKNRSKPVYNCDQTAAVICLFLFLW